MTLPGWCWLVVVVLIVWAWAGFVLRYKPATSGQEEILSRGVLLHVTTAAHGEEIDQGDGTVWLRPRSGMRGALLELFHQNWSVLRGRGSAYVWSALPEDHEFAYHVNPAKAEVVVRIPGSELLAQAGHRGVWCSPHDGAVAIRGGYRGPGQVVDINTVMTPPDPLSRWQWVVFIARATVRARPHL